MSGMHHQVEQDAVFIESRLSLGGITLFIVTMLTIYWLGQTAMEYESSIREAGTAYTEVEAVDAAPESPSVSAPPGLATGLPAAGALK